ncbi:iron chelate uptake ABC transporter family permease subunit, partial [Candidatus Saccharibacteria bacterium]|nr:iron chelate uptake ABC transporter family permease subunit [Calditrichia bacterium]NIV72417.1 iron chelate uptake ABC transporter family permease subunit [Calditrichia bacterium]NIW00126.1 iron chelate uptake ABC transporter family permease subunit [Candidatus Saccharibacteria bacterium]NIW79782.1 iron chelate uptake ABC transporter family permease subunit [Calditrichia bacterium]
MPIKKQSIIIFVSFLFMSGILTITPFIGSQSLDYEQLFQFINGNNTPDGMIFFRIRLPRIIFGILTGAALSVAGVVFQALLRNPLATPYTLGVSSGSALGALLMIKLGLSFTILGFSNLQIAAFAGSLITVALVYFLSQKLGRISIYSMILVGITINYF